MNLQRILLSIAAPVAAAALLAPPAAAQVLTKTLVVNGLPNTLYVTSPPGDLNRLFVVRQTGQVHIVKNGTLLGTTFIHLGVGGANKITSGGERGLLGLAFHPNYAQNGFFYVNYTNLQGNTMVERYTVSANPDVADLASAATIIGPITQPQSNHNGGCLQFGPETTGSMLYIAMGDGGGANDSGAGHAAGGNGQSGATLLGKFLRLDVDLASPHIPVDNPFVNDPNVLDEIWHVGMRNPWRFSFDSLTGDMYIGDVGQDAREEVDFQPAGVGGLNYGWRCMEGFNCTGLSGCTCNAPNLTLPIHDYAHTPGCVTVTGGYVYRGCSMPSLQGTYFFADYCKVQVWSFEYDGVSVNNFQNRTAEIVATGGALSTISSFGQDGYGELYICDLAGGRVYKIVDAAGVKDCNANSVADACDIAVGTSLDANQNAIPDECECSPGPAVYCTPKLNSQGCLPVVSTLGTPKIVGPYPFLIQADQVLNNMNGILFYGYAAGSIPFQGGTLCITGSVVRTALQNSGGNPGSATDCSGDYGFDFSAYVLSGADPMLIAGQQFNAQFWGRDINDPAGFGSSLSDAVEFVLCN